MAENSSRSTVVPKVASIPEASQAVFNQVLFTEADVSWTSRDLKLYKKLLQLLTKKEKMTPFSKSSTEDFLLSRLLKREALLFEIAPQKLSMSSSVNSELSGFTKLEIEQEIKMISEALALLDLKSSQVSQKIRFQVWMDVLKRKYSVKIKSTEF